MAKSSIPKTPIQISLMGCSGHTSCSEHTNLTFYKNMINLAESFLEALKLHELDVPLYLRSYKRTCHRYN